MLTNAANPADVDALIARANALEPRWAKLAGVPTASDCLQNGGDVPALDFDGTEIRASIRLVQSRESRTAMS